MSKITLADFVTSVNEAGRGRPRKNDIVAKQTDDGRTIVSQKPDPDSIVGKDEEHNGSNGLFAIDPPTDEDLNFIWDDIPEEEITENVEAIIMKLESDDPFFIMGEAGWGKTSIIEKIAKRFGKTIITVYLDKAVKEDLDGLPIPEKGKHVGFQNKAVPAWAAYIIEHPETDFLLFFDEMNQADPGVMNALMPIVQKRELCGYQPGPRDAKGRRIKPNFVVGAAGNFAHENEDGISELSGPLKSRFAPIIIWKSGSDEDWDNAFRYLHKQWDDKLDPELINIVAQYCKMFKNPREVEAKIFNWVYKLEKSSKKKLLTSRGFLKQITGLANIDDDSSEDLQDKATALADILYKYVKNDESWNPKNKKKARRGQDFISDIDRDRILTAMTKGYILADDVDEKTGKTTENVKFGISKENIFDVMCSDEYYTPDIEDNDALNAEMLQRLLDKFEADGYKFKYNTDDEFKAAKLRDPLN